MFVLTQDTVVELEAQEDYDIPDDGYEAVRR